METSSLEKIQESYLGQHFKGYKGEIKGSCRSALHANDLDSLLAQELTKLTIKEREESYEDLHGVDDVVNETPELVYNCLNALDAELHRIAQKDAYWLAEEQDQAYVTNPKFRLRFLRAERFVPKSAAKRLVGFLEGKLHFFGPSLLTKPIKFSDLDKDDQACLKYGQMQVLPSRDRSGRSIFCDMNMIKDRCFKRPANRLKAWIYILMTLAEDEENQKRGIVCLLMQLGHIHPWEVDAELAKENPRIMNWVPIRVSGFHQCLDDSPLALLSVLARICIVAGPADIRARHRIHNQSYVELIYTLMTYGIPVDLFPMNSDSVIKKTNHNRWIARRKVKELALGQGGGGTFSGIDLPTRQDVLLGKGKPVQTHMGNIKLRGLVDVHMDEYKATENGLKGIVILHILETVKASSGRFLIKDNDGWWQEVPDNIASDKIFKNFYSAATKLKESASFLNIQQNESSSIFQPEKRRKLQVWNSCWG
jgi:hypothetical protein